MAEDFNLKGDDARAFQKSMQVIVDLMGKSARHSSIINDNTNKTAQQADHLNKAQREYLNQTEKVKGYTQSLVKENKILENSMKVKGLLIGSNLTVEQAELVVAKELALEELKAAGVSGIKLKLAEQQYAEAVKVADENARLNNLQEQQEELAEKILQYEEERKAALEGINSTAEVFKDIMTDGRLAAGIFTGQLIKGYKSSKEVFEGVREQGIGITGAFKETGLAVSDAFSFSAVSAKDSMEATKGLRSELGSISEVTRDVRINAGQLAATYGISNEEAGKLTAQISKLPGSSLEAANSTLEFAGNLATAAGVAPGDVMRDIASNADATAQFSKEGGKNIAIAAVAAKKLGVEFGTIVSSAESLLDFEGSIEKQMEASVLLGREINLDKARQLALEGDLVGATEEMLKNVGSEAEFNKLNVVQRKALAESMGVSVSQLGSMVKNQDKLSSLTQEQRDALSSGEASMDEILSSSAGFASKLKEGGITVFSLVKGFGDIRKGMKSSVEGVKAFFGGLKQGSGLLDKVKKSVGGLLTGGDDLPKKSTKPEPKSAGKSTGGLTDSIQKIKPGKLLAGAAALVVVAAAVFVFAKAAQEFGEVSWESIGKAIVGMLSLVGALALIGAIMMSGVGAVAILAGAGAMVIMASALFILGKAIQEIGKGFAIFTPALLELAPMAGQLLLVGASLAVVGVGLLALGAAALYASGGLALGAIGLMAMVPGLYMINEIAQNNVMGDLSTNLMNLSASASGLGAVGASLFGIAGGLGAMALAGFAALPIIGSLIALAAVAPALGKLADVFGGGGSDEDDKLGEIADKLDTLISVASQGGVINMDGKKVGDVVRLSITSSGIK